MCLLLLQGPHPPPIALNAGAETDAQLKVPLAAAAAQFHHEAGQHLSGSMLALAVKPPSREDYRKGAALISRTFASRGITSACEADGNPLTLQGYLDARDAGELAGRFYVHIDFDHLDRMTAAGVHTGLGDDRVRLGAIKLFADGALVASGALRFADALEAVSARGRRRR